MIGGNRAGICGQTWHLDGSVLFRMLRVLRGLSHPICVHPLLWLTSVPGFWFRVGVNNPHPCVSQYGSTVKNVFRSLCVSWCHSCLSVMCGRTSCLGALVVRLPIHLPVSDF